MRNTISVDKYIILLLLLIGFLPVALFSQTIKMEVATKIDSLQILLDKSKLNVEKLSQSLTNMDQLIKTQTVKNAELRKQDEKILARIDSLKKEYNAKTKQLNDLNAQYQELLKIEKENPKSFVDSRDGKVYKTIKIGNQLWMAENLNYQDVNSFSINISIFSESVRTSLMKDVIGIPTSWNYYTYETAKNVCPNGWELPSQEEWLTLFNFFISQDINNSIALVNGSTGFNFPLLNFYNSDLKNEPDAINKTIEIGTKFGEVGLYSIYTENIESLQCVEIRKNGEFNFFKIPASDISKMGFLVRCVKNNGL